MADDLENLCNKLTLEDNDADNDEVTLDDEGIREIQDVSGSCLAAKMLLRRPFSIAAMTNTFMKAWQLTEGLEIKQVANRVFLFKFDDPMIKARVWVRQPWYFNQSLMVFNKIPDNGEINVDKGFDECPFWIQLHGIPILWMTEKIGNLLGGKIGRILEVEADKGKLACGKWLRVRVLVKVTRHLKKGCWLSWTGGERRWVTFKWEKLPGFCYVCGSLCHLENDCDKLLHMQLQVERTFDSSLRADGFQALHNKGPSSSSSANSKSK